MQYTIEQENLDDFYRAIASLEALLSERIDELKKAKDGVQARHLFYYYKSLLLEAKYSIRDKVKAIESCTK